MSVDDHVHEWPAVDEEPIPEPTRELSPEFTFGEHPNVRVTIDGLSFDEWQRLRRWYEAMIDRRDHAVI
jgi:hypothetical protein